MAIATIAPRIFGLIPRKLPDAPIVRILKKFSLAHHDLLRDNVAPIGQVRSMRLARDAKMEKVFFRLPVCHSAGFSLS